MSIYAVGRQGLPTCSYYDRPVAISSGRPTDLPASKRAGGETPIEQEDVSTSCLMSGDFSVERQPACERRSFSMMQAVDCGFARPLGSMVEPFYGASRRHDRRRELR